MPRKTNKEFQTESAASFSVVIANHNYADFVGEAISSALAQDYPSALFEIIVVDDGSTDASVSVIEAFKNNQQVHIIRQSNQGQAAAFKAGLNVAQHEWVCFLDSDDYFKPEKLSRLNTFIQMADESCHFISHDVDALDDAQQTSQSWFKRQNIKSDRLSVDEANGRYPFANPCGQVYRKALLESIFSSLVCEDWRRGADNPLAWGALLLSGGVCYLHESLAVYRIHTNNHFLSAGPKGLVPKVNWLARWPKLLAFLQRLHQENAARCVGEGNRDALLERLRQYVQHWVNKASSSRERTGAPLVSFITTCKNRLHHLKQTLPKMAMQSNAEVIVVDYGCSQGTSDWVRAHYPQVRIVEVNDDPGWRISRARNLGAAQARGAWLCFIDADMILRGDLGAWVTRKATEGHYYLAAPMPSYTAKGTVVCQRSAHHSVGGYDEAYQGWFPEDGDFYAALRELGQKEGGFPAKFLMPIEHGDDERELGGTDQMDSRAQAMRVALLYQMIKQDITRLSGARPGLKARKQLLKTLMERTKKFEASGNAADGQFIIGINQGLDSYQTVNLDRRLSYSFRNPRHIFRPQAEALVAREKGAKEKGAGQPVPAQRHADKLRVVMFHIGRSGSTVLADMLAQHEGLHWDREIYESQIQAIEKRLGHFQFGSPEYGFNPFEVLSKRLSNFATTNYGFEVKFNHLEHCGCDLPDYVQFLKKQGVNKFIVLERKNSFRKIVSSLMAEKTGAWHIKAGETAPKGKLHVNPHEIVAERRSGTLMEFLDGYAREFKKLDSLLSSTPFLRLTFEDDIEPDPMIGYFKAAAYLGLKSMAPQIRLGKTNPFPLSELVENLGEIQAYLRGTCYAWMIEEKPH